MKTLEISATWRHDVLRPTLYTSRVTHHASRFKWIATLVIALLLGAMFCFLLSPTDDGTLADIQRRGTLRVGLDASFPPFEAHNDNGQIVGLDVDIAQAIAADLGVEIELVNIGFDGLYDALLARRVDIVISGLPYDPRWTQDVAYTHTYFNAGQILVAPVNENSITVIEEIANRTVAVEWGSQADMEGRHLEQRLADITLLRHATAGEALDAIFNNQADAAIVDAVSGVSAFPRGLKIVTYLTDEWYAAAVHIESQELLATVNQSLAHLEQSGKMAKMQAKWLHGNGSN